MPRAEVGSTKYIANQMKSKGLQRLRWYCQACERQMRDENGFKCHVASESHVRNMQLIGEDPRKAINGFSNDFKRDFLQLLRTGHGEKKINLNQFYNEYISHKEHVHMNATKWASLTEFAKHLGREGMCRVEEDEKKSDRGGASGLMIAWIDNSPEAMRRQETLKRKERQDKGDEEREQRMIDAQIRKAKKQGLRDADEDDVDDALKDDEGEGIKRPDGEKIVLTFGSKKEDADKIQPPTPPRTDKESGSEREHSVERDVSAKPESLPASPELKSESTTTTPAVAAAPIKTSISSSTVSKPISMSLNSSKPKNVFAAASKKNAFAGSKKPAVAAQQKPMSEAERIMKEEIERKRQRELNGGNAFKRQRVG